MKLLITIFFYFSSIMLAQNYEASVTIVQLRWKTEHEWHAELRADIYLNGILLLPYVDYDPGDNTYLWQLFNERTGNWDNKSTIINQWTDGQANQAFQWRVQISGPGFSDLSDPRSIVKYGTIKAVDCNAYKQDGSNANLDVNVNVWATYNFLVVTVVP